ncbi:MAG TPA: hypothetical protein VKU44_10305 [Terriglobia bacterium]|nr:hypothetical protein [Terriglobia bacterium]
MDEYRKARRVFIRLLAVSLSAALGLDAATSWFKWIPKQSSSGGRDLVRIVAISLVLYGSYHLFIEWSALSSEERASGRWQKDYTALQNLAFFAILLGYALEFIRSTIDFFGTPRMGWVVEAWAAGFMGGGGLLFANRAKLRLLIVLTALIIAGNIAEQTILSIVYTDSSILVTFVLVMLWSFGASVYFPFVIFPSTRLPRAVP